MSAATVRLSPADVRAIALEIVELLEERSLPTRAKPHRRLVDAATVAAELGVTREWVYEHKDSLGAEKLGEGKRPRLRFDLDRARQISLRNEVAPKAAAPTAVAGRRRSSLRRDNSTTLLPIQGEAPH